MKHLKLSVLFGLLSLNTSSIIIDAAWAADVAHPMAVSKCVAKEWKNIESVDAEVSRVVDGDTVRVVVEDREFSVRMVGIDTPETHYQGKSQGYWGDEAAERMAKLLQSGDSVTVMFGKDVCDRYGRMLGTVWLNDKNINLQIAKDGYAVNYCIYPETDCEEYALAVRKNVKKKKGIFSNNPAVELPYEWRRQMSDRPFEKYVGNMFTHKVYEPGSYEQVPVSDRIFFMRKSDVHPPYYLVDSIKRPQ